MSQTNYNEPIPTTTSTDNNHCNNNSSNVTSLQPALAPVATIKELDRTIAVTATMSTPTSATPTPATLGMNNNSTMPLDNHHHYHEEGYTINSENNREQGPSDMLQNTPKSMYSSSSSPSKPSETFEDMYDYECDNSSTSTGIDDHDELEDDLEDEEKVEQDKQIGDRRFHLPHHHSSRQFYHLQGQHHFSDDEEDKEEGEGKGTSCEGTNNTLEHHAIHHCALDYSHRSDTIQNEQGEEAQAKPIALTTSPPAADNDIDVNDGMSASSSYSECSDEMSPPSSPNPDTVDDKSNGHDSHQTQIALSSQLLQPPQIHQSQKNDQQQYKLNTTKDVSSSTTSVNQQKQQQQQQPTTTTSPPELNPKSSSRPHLAIPRSIHFRANTPSDRSAIGSRAPLGRLQIHTVNRLEVENSFLLNQNNSLTRDIHHCRQTVQALKQILAQREDTIVRMKQEAQQAQLKIKFMESLMSDQRHFFGQQQQQQRCSVQQIQLQPQHSMQQHQQQEQNKGLVGNWKERHSQDDDDYDDDYDDDEDDDEDEDEEIEGEEEDEEEEEEEERSTSLLDTYAAAQNGPSFNRLLKGWDKGGAPVVENRDSYSRDPAGVEVENENDQERDIRKQILSIVSGINDRIYNYDEYTDDDDDDEEGEEEEENKFTKNTLPKSGDLKAQSTGSYRHYPLQQRLLSNGGGESCISALSMSLGNNSTCILAHKGIIEDDKGTKPCNTVRIETLLSSDDTIDGSKSDESAFVTVSHQESSSGSLPSPALSDSSMSLVLESSGSSESVTSLSSSSIPNNITSASNVCSDERDAPAESSHHPQTPIEVISNTGAESNDQQELPLPVAIPLGTFRDSGHFPTQVFLKYDEQHLVVGDDPASQHQDHDVHESLFSDQSFSALPPASRERKIEEKDSHSMSLIQAKDNSQNALPLCQPNGHGSNLCLSTSPPIATPLALISLVNIEARASSTTLISASNPSPTPTAIEGNSEGKEDDSGVVTWKPNAFDYSLEGVRGGDEIGGVSLPDSKEYIMSEEISLAQKTVALAVDSENSCIDKIDIENSNQLSVKAASKGAVASATTGLTWGPLSLFKGLLPSKRKHKTRSSKSKDKNGGVQEKVLIDSGDCVQEQSVAWAALKNQTSPALAVSAAAEPKRAAELQPPVSMTLPTSATLLTRVFSIRSRSRA